MSALLDAERRPVSLRSFRTYGLSPTELGSMGIPDSHTSSSTTFTEEEIAAFLSLSSFDYLTDTEWLCLLRELLLTGFPG